MKLKEWVDDIFKNGIELFKDEISTVNEKGVIVKRNVKLLRQCSLGAIATNNAKEWYLICRLHAPVGTVIEEYDDSWESKYEEIVTLCRLGLTKSLVEERNMKSSKVLMDILTKRDNIHWSEQKQISVDNNTSDSSSKISINIVGV